MEQVILVNEKDEAIGLMEKMQAHREGVLHRAFSIFIFNERGEMLIHQRADEKYHSAGLWTNACCSHPREGESILEAANRRLHEEMGMITELKEMFSFIYRAELEHGLVEHELDHVLIGITDDDPQINPAEVSDFRWLETAVIADELNQNPSKYTAWFRIAFPKVMEQIVVVE